MQMRPRGVFKAQVRPEGWQVAGLTSDSPVPPCFPSTLGTPFYLMEHCAGRVHSDVSLPTLQPGQRRAVYAAMSQVLAKIHSIDLRAARLEDLGEHGERRLCMVCHCLLLLSISISGDRLGYRTWPNLGAVGKAKMGSKVSESPGMVGGCGELLQILQVSVSS